MEVKDQMGHIVNLESKPKRIISLVPSQSELLWHIGLREELIGITKFCIHPDEMFRTKERVGGTKELNLEKIKALKPDLIIGNKEENDEEQIGLLQKEFNVWMSDIVGIDDSLQMMSELGQVLDKEKEVKILQFEIEKSLNAVKDLFSGNTVAYFMWHEPYMLAAGQTFINTIVEHIGLKNVMALKVRYPVVSINELRDLNPDFCFLSSEPFPFKQKHADELSHAMPNSKIVLVDGEMFSWYGSRMRLLGDYINNLKNELVV